jgi:hypothetical protein
LIFSLTLQHLLGCEGVPYGAKRAKKFISVAFFYLNLQKVNKKRKLKSPLEAILPKEQGKERGYDRFFDFFI